MNRHRLPPPAPACLVRATPSSQKGGTLIAENVCDWQTHQRRLCDPDGYRPAACPRCRHQKLHVHDYRLRRLRAEAGRPVATVVRHRCAHADCRATWLVLPLIIARHLWRSWSVVERVVLERAPGRRPEVPPRTRRRWRARLKASARTLVALLATSGRSALEAIARASGLDGTRYELLAQFHDGMAALAALIHRLMPGVRLM